jgi:hypothetical protein
VRSVRQVNADDLGNHDPDTTALTILQGAEMSQESDLVRHVGLGGHRV